jgi:hypothetical protein
MLKRLCYVGDKPSRGVCKKPVCLAWLCILALLPVATTVRAQGTTEPLVAVYDSGEPSLADVLSGASGEATLLYYTAKTGPERPALVVRFTKAEGAADAVVRIFDAPPGLAHIPVTFVRGYPLVPANIGATITLRAPDGWWVRDGLVNYNLEVQVYGPVVAMWGSEGSTGWAQFVGRGYRNARILVGDSDGDGLPDWDWRTMLLNYPGRGDYRSSYAERKCPSPISMDGGPFPTWPFVAGHSHLGYEQAPGTYRPPIVVDWAAGRVLFFSEIVTLRNQNCSYGMYSIERVVPGELNHPDFETPFAFYDLSGRGQGHPNLIIRTGRILLREEVTGLTYEHEQMEVIRYSWSNQNVGDGSMDYKIEVFGFHPYDFVTAIADGGAWIDAPPYGLFPGWVIGREWPVVTFVDSESVRYMSSEGIYEWSPGDLDYGYYLGYSDWADVGLFADIGVGLRGEYRLETEQQSLLYLSPIDNRLHLKWAERGVWRLDEEQVVRVDNLDGDAFLDLWTREAMAVAHEPSSGAEIADRAADEAAAEPQVIETLVALSGHLLHAGENRVTLVETDHQPSLFETLPPTDHDTWQTHRSQLAPYEKQRRDPRDLSSWLDGFPGARTEISGAALAKLRRAGGGVRFELSLSAGYHVAGPDPMGIDGLAPGDYLVQAQAGAFTVQPLLPSRLSLELQQLSSRAGVPARIQITVRNTGLADAPPLTLYAEAVGFEGEALELAHERVAVLAGQAPQVLLDVPSTVAAGSEIRAWMEDLDGRVWVGADPLLLAGPEAPAGEPIWSILWMPYFLPLIGLAALFLAVAVFVAVGQRQRWSA